MFHRWEMEGQGFVCESVSLTKIQTIQGIVCEGIPQTGS